MGPPYGSVRNPLSYQPIVERLPLSWQCPSGYKSDCILLITYTKCPTCVFCISHVRATRGFSRFSFQFFYFFIPYFFLLYGVLRTEYEYPWTLQGYAKSRLFTLANA